MDTDFLVLKPLGPYLNLLEDNDIISYSDEKTTTSTTCSKTYSSNWHAGKKGNPFSSVWWRNIKKLLTRKCPSGDYQDSVERVCCHEEGAPDKSSNVCHIPWAHVEQLKTPARWAHDHKIDADTIEQPATPVKTYCLNGRRSLTPQLNGELFWMYVLGFCPCAWGEACVGGWEEGGEGCARCTWRRRTPHECPAPCA